MPNVSQPLREILRIRCSLFTNSASARRYEILNRRLLCSLLPLLSLFAVMSAHAAGNHGPSGTAAMTRVVSTITAGGYHSCGIKTDSTLSCWGFNNAGQTVTPAGTFTQVAGGGYHSCGRKTDGTLACWGDNTYGQAAPPAGTFTQVATGGIHTCGVKSDGTATCWGSNGFSQTIAPAGSFLQVAGGGGHNCGLKTDGTLG